MTAGGPGNVLVRAAVEQARPRRRLGVGGGGVYRGSSVIGVLLLQLGTPDSTAVGDVRRYLREFLGDPRVLDVPAPLRAFLLNVVILPFRPRRSAEQYAKIWTPEGSPLLLHTEALAAAVAERLGEGFRVEVAMRYRNPSIESALGRLEEAGCQRIIVLPLFPQYASASGGSAVAKVLEVAASRVNVPDVTTIGAFYDDPRYVAAVAAVARPVLAEHAPDHVLFSYHGLPESQITKADPSGSWCLASESCCDTVTDVNRNCYRAQCYATSRALAAALGLAEGTWSTSFQSRLAGQQWIRPFTDHVLPELFERGVRRLAVLTPSFVADCLETLEEIGIRARDQWAELGGEDFALVPCVNSDDVWVDAVVSLVREAVATRSG